MARPRSNTKSFISKATLVHGSKYDYSKTHYVKALEKVIITCPIHGDFEQLASAHLQGEGCPKCQRSRKGGAFLDISYKENKQAYFHWRAIIGRCFDENYREKHQTYKHCSICNEWLYFSNFKSWFEDHANGYQDGYHLDKDILFKGNKLYSPTTCCFVPQELNKLLTKRNIDRGSLPIGVSKNSGRGKPYVSNATIGGKQVYLGKYNTPEEAFYAYKYVKEQYIREIAEKYFQEGKITKKVYDALFRYEVEITD